MEEKYLPIGTVVMLKGGKKRVMITGFCVINSADNKMYDYCGCIYPEGFIDSTKNLLFNHEQIDKVYCKGYVDEEEIEFKEMLKNTLSKIESLNQENSKLENQDDNNSSNQEIIQFSE